MNSNPRWSIAAVGIALLLALSSVGSAQSTASVTGRVVDSTSGQPVASARVSVVGSNGGTLTHRDGRYLLQGLSPGVVTLRAQRIGITPVHRSGSLGAGGTGTAGF